MQLNSKIAFKLKDGVICEMIDQDMVLFCPDTNCIANLNRTASKICKLLQTRISFDLLLNLFYNQFQEDGRPQKEIVENDLKKILEKLDEVGMLSRSEV